MKRKFTFVAATLTLLAILIAPLGMKGQSNYSTNYTGNITLSTSGGANASTCKVKINNTDYNGIKAGTANNSGVNTVKILVPSGTKYLHLHIAAWSGESPSVSITPATYSSTTSISPTSDGGIQGTSTTYTLTGTLSNYYKVITFTSALNQDIEFSFSTSGKKKRFVIWGVTAEANYSVTYNGNGNTGGSVPTDNTAYSSGATVTVLGNSGNLAKTGYTFNGWNTKNDGSGTHYAAGGTFNITANTTLYAEWTANASTTYSVTYNGNGNTSGSVPTDNTAYSSGATVTVSGNTGSLAKTGYTFNGWNTKDDGTGTHYAAGGTFSITANTTLYAEWTASGGSGSEDCPFVLVTSLSDVVEGDYVLCGIYNGTTYAMNNTISSSLMGGTPVSVNNGQITEPAASIVWHLTPATINNTSCYTLYNAAADKYCMISSDKVKGFSLEDAATQGFSIIANNASSGTYHLTTTLSGCTRKIRLYESDFRAYNTSDGKDLYLYKKAECATIEGYGTDNGKWHLITSPLASSVAPTAVTNMIPKVNGTLDVNSTAYDLYSFDATKELEWVNYKVSSDNGGGFNLVAGKGYLYANTNTVTLIFTGAPYSGDGTFTLYPYENPNNEAMDNANLVGNPYSQAATVNKLFYKMNDDGTGIIASTTNSVEAMEGIFVIYNATSATSVKFTPAGKSSNIEPNAILALNLSQGQGVMDRAIVRFDNSNTLPKLQLWGNTSQVYIPVDGKDYAVVNAQGQGELPVSFKAKENGTYTLSTNTKDVSFGYLHLIDNLTGNDVDLLATPSYSFEAKTTDYANRFKLVFTATCVDEDGDNDFAFFSNGSLVVNNPSTGSGAATLQVIDVNGRILKSESINGCANVNLNAAPGVYMIRLVNGNDVKTQKVVVR